MLNEFLTWWTQQLLALLPDRLVQREDREQDALVVEPSPERPTSGVLLLLRRRGREQALGRFALDDAGIRALRAARGSAGRRANVILRLPPGLLLEQHVTLPLAAERDLDSVLGYEMDRITPFAANDIFWTAAIERRDRAQGKLLVRLVLVPKPSVAALLAALDPAGVAPTLLEAATPGGAPRLIPLHPARHSPGKWRKRSLVLAGATCAMLAIVAAALPFFEQSQNARTVEKRIATLRPQVDQVNALRRRISATEAGSDVIAAQRARVGDTLGMLAALTDLLPDDTYLTDLTLRARSANISGESAAAARLIAALAADPSVRNPAFTAPVTRNEGGHTEGFSLRAEFEP